MKTKNKLLIIMLLVSVAKSTFAQITKLDNQRPATGTPYPFTGWDNSGTPGDLDIKNEFTGTGNDINFVTGTTQKATILNNGNVGIGNSFTNPAHKLDVYEGDINIGDATTWGENAYRIQGEKILWHNNQAGNIFVGVNSGSSNASTRNTLMGHSTGSFLTIGAFDNTFVGWSAE